RRCDRETRPVDRTRQGARASRDTATVPATPARLGHESVAGTPDPRADRAPAGRGQGAARTLSGTVRADRGVAARRFLDPPAPETRSTVDREARRDADVQEPPARVLPATSPEG